MPPKKITDREGAEGFNAWDPKILQQIDALVALATPPQAAADNSDLVREMIVTALKTEYSQLERGDVKILNRALRELRYGFRIFKNYRDRRKVTIFGSARTRSHDPDYKLALQFARLMGKNGYMMITGAGPGIMQAGNEGAGKGNSFGINIRLPFEQEANEFISNDPLFIDCRFFFTRKLMFLKETSAIAFFPGGFGTHDEAFEALTLVQTGKCDPMPIVLANAPGEDYWKDWKHFITKQLLNKGKISPEDMSVFRIVETAEEAAHEILHFYKNYHSMRFVKDDLIIRLRKALSPAQLDQLNQAFKDICVKGSVRESAALPEEMDHRELPRIALRFNRSGFGRLRQMIDRLNAL
ncbi:MAG: hypothetical protein A2992_05400 [Elusimicrobia bacterium RIFCSPLOWO2_01_FULL_59_12]|nr:MAG: hypothetical protein A2992_05400 [Elusimicrobia bacterium RIFCSPLOWO2_01_FULL_59_12]